MEAGNSKKLILYFATNCPRRIVRDELSATNCPATICPRRIVRDQLSCNELSGNPSKRLKLNAYKTQFIWFGTFSNSRSLISLFCEQSQRISFSSSFRDLSIALESSLTCTSAEHILYNL